MDQHAQKVADVFYEMESIRVLKPISSHMPRSFSNHPHIDGCCDIIQHKQEFRTHISSILQAQPNTLAQHITDHRAGFADGSLLIFGPKLATAVAIDPVLVPSLTTLATRMSKMKPKGLGESTFGG